MPAPLIAGAAKAAPVVVTAAKSLLGPVLAGAASIFGGAQANRANARMAREQMAFQERMSSTAYQRQQADLRAAGLNPYMSNAGGSGASSPGGSMAGQSDVVAPAVSRALEARMFREQLATAEFNKRTAFHQAEKAAADAKERKAETDVYDDPAIREMIGNLVRSQLGFGATKYVADAKYYNQNAANEAQMLQYGMAGAKAESVMNTGVMGIIRRVLPLLPGASGISSLMNAGGRELDRRRGVERSDSDGKSTFTRRYKP